MRFKTFLEYKYLNLSSVRCGHCMDRLIPMKITNNPKHFYSHGQMFECSCGKSKVWTNSIRNIKNLADFMNNKCDRYHNGFCNDMFCGHCHEYIYPLKNGVSIPGEEQRFDKYGCLKCQQNQDILIDGSQKDPENEKSTKKLINYYQRHKDVVDKLADEGY